MNQELIISTFLEKSRIHDKTQQRVLQPRVGAARLFKMPFT
jgi:hypothetical protein